MMDMNLRARISPRRQPEARPSAGTGPQRRQIIGWISPLRTAALLAVLAAGCGPKANEALPGYQNKLGTMKTTQIRIKEQAFDVWLALDNDQRERGLMQVTEKELAPVDGAIRGMLFVFPDEQYLSFWMYNTITPLDIAYINADGLIVKTHTMAPLETRLYPSVEPAQFALEVLAGTFEQLKIAAGDTVEIPDETRMSNQARNPNDE